jgi:Uma2 family endonuclease
MTQLADAIRLEDLKGPLVMTDVPWSLYRQMAQVYGERHFRFMYDAGTLTVMPPLPAHDKPKKLLARMVEALSEEWSIPIESYGSSTWDREDLLKGLEADECYYVQNAAAVAGRVDIDLTRDPPPDLAIEVELTSILRRREGIYADLGVPELWRYRVDRSVKAYALRQGRYVEIDRSLAFPELKISVLGEFLAGSVGRPEFELLGEFRAFVRILRPA